MVPQNLLLTHEGKQVFSDLKKNPIFKRSRSNQRDCSLREHLFLSYHLILVPWVGRACDYTSRGARYPYDDKTNLPEIHSPVLSSIHDDFCMVTHKKCTRKENVRICLRHLIRSQIGFFSHQKGQYFSYVRNLM